MSSPIIVAPRSAITAISALSYLLMTCTLGTQDGFVSSGYPLSFFYRITNWTFSCERL